MSEEIKIDDFDYFLENDLKVIGLICENKEKVSIILKPKTTLYKTLSSHVSRRGCLTSEFNSKKNKRSS